MAQPREVEAKFLVARPSVLEALGWLRLLGPLRRSGRSSVERQENRYWDTADFRLRRARSVLKSRRVGRRTEVTFKREVAYRRGVSERVEVTVPAGAKRPAQFLASNRPAGPVQLARKIAGTRPLREVLALRTVRRKLLFGSGKKKVELDLDRVTVLRGRRRIAVHLEVELENQGASDADFRRALKDLRRGFRGRIHPSRVSKYERGLRLLKRI